MPVCFIMLFEVPSCVIITVNKNWRAILFMARQS